MGRLEKSHGPRFLQSDEGLPSASEGLPRQGHLYPLRRFLPYATPDCFYYFFFLHGGIDVQYLHLDRGHEMAGRSGLSE